MKIIPIGIGQAGSNIVDDIILRNILMEEKRGVSYLQRVNGLLAAFAANLGGADLSGLSLHFPIDDQHRIFMGALGGYMGRGAGMNNQIGAGEAEAHADELLKIIKENSSIDYADAFFIFASTGGGTGSGGISVFGDALAKEYKKPVIAVLMLPFASDYDNAGRMLNTGTCLNEVLFHSQVNATILLDNQHFVKRNAAANDNLRVINRMFVESIADLLCMGEETEPRYIGQVIDSNDILNSLSGITAIGSSLFFLPKRRKIKIPVGRSNRETHHFRDTQDLQLKVKNEIEQALKKNMSIDCSMDEGRETYYDAGSVVTCLVGGKEVVSQGVMEMVDRVIANQLYKKVSTRWVGTYPRDLDGSIGLCVMLSDIGLGSAYDLVNSFIERADKLRSEAEKEQGERVQHWDTVKKNADRLPRLRAPSDSSEFGTR